MSDSAASSGLGMLLAPAQAAANGVSKVSTDSSSIDVTDGNGSSFSSILAGQGETSADLAGTQVVQETGQVANVDQPLTELQQAVAETLDGGQALPIGGNPLPVVTTSNQSASIEATLSGVTPSVESGLSVSLAGSVGNQPAAAFDSESIIGQIVDAQLAAEAGTRELSEKSALAASQVVQSTQLLANESDGAVASGLIAGTGLNPGGLLSTVETPEVQMVKSNTDQSGDENSASLTLMSMLDRKSRLGEAATQSADTITLDMDGDSLLNQELSDNLLIKNLQAASSPVGTDEFSVLQQKLTDLTLALSPKSQNSIEINSLPSWRLPETTTYSSNPVSGPAMSIDVPVSKPAWGAAVLDKVMWMSSQKLDSAEIALDPVDLGPMHVRITTQNDQTTVVFSSPHVQVRDALDQASAQLRQNLENQGFGQVNVDVSGRNGEQQMQRQEGDRSGDSSRQAGMDDEAIIAERAALSAQPVRVGLVDTFV